MNLQKAILTLNTSQNPAGGISFIQEINPVSLLLVTLAYIVSMLSLPLEALHKLIWFAFYPIIMAQMADQTYMKLMRNSIVILPFIICIGIFNPYYDHREAFYLGDFKVTYGWITFISLLLRGVLATQALLIFIKIAGFRKICGSLKSIGIPNVLVVQLMVMYRFIGILMEEALSLKRAVQARGFGRKSFPIKIWTRLVGSLLLRSIDRAKNVHEAMLSRGFTGNLPLGKKSKWSLRDILFCGSWILIFLVLRLFDLSHIFI